MLKRSSERRRNRPGTRSDLDDPAVGIVTHHHTPRVAREALRRFRGNARTVFEDGLARVIGIRQDVGVDVDHHLIAFARRTRIDLLMQRGLRKQREGVGLLLRHRRRVVARRRLPVQHRARSVQRAQEQGPRFRRQTSPYDNRTVIILIHVQRAARGLASGLTQFCLSVHPSPAAHDPFDVLGGASAGDRE